MSQKTKLRIEHKCKLEQLELVRLFSRKFELLALPDLTAAVMSLTLFQGNVILSLFRDPFLIEPPESGTR